VRLHEGSLLEVNIADRPLEHGEIRPETFPHE
jgi:hypothetical protein